MIWIILAIFAIWGIILYVAKKKGKKYGLDIYGPLLMLKTEKGKKLIEKISRKKLWKHYGNVSIIICIIAMLFATYLIFRSFIISFKISPPQAPSPRLMIGLPGINPIIPIGYGILALAVAIIVHEFSHGIMARYGKIKVNALGLLFLIFPIGAFVEPDEKELKKANIKKRSKIFAAGPASNIILAIICIFIISFIFAPAIKPRTDGAILTHDVYNLERWSIIDKIDGKDIESINDVKLVVGKFYNITLFYNGKETEKRIFYGLYVLNIFDGSPAEENGIKKGSIIYKIDGVIANKQNFLSFMNSTKAGDEVKIYLYYNGRFINKSIILANKYNFTGEEKGKGFLGVEVGEINDFLINTDYFQNLMNPLKTNFFLFLSLPFTGFSPLPKEIANMYTPSHTFWILYNSLYWIFWLNFAVGTFNALPSIPLDGGYIFKDIISYSIPKLNKRIRKERIEKISSSISTIISIIILLSIFSIIIIPRLRFFISS